MSASKRSDKVYKALTDANERSDRMNTALFVANENSETGRKDLSRYVCNGEGRDRQNTTEQFASWYCIQRNIWKWVELSSLPEKISKTSAEKVTEHPSRWNLKMYKKHVRSKFIQNSSAVSKNSWSGRRCLLCKRNLFNASMDLLIPFLSWENTFVNKKQLDFFPSFIYY